MHRTVNHKSFYLPNMTELYTNFVSMIMIAYNATAAVVEDVLRLVPKLDILILEGHAPQLINVVVAVRRLHPAAVVLPWVLTSLEASRLRAHGDAVRFIFHSII